MFKGCHFPSQIILQAVRYYVSYKLSYREIEEIYAERGIRFDHATLNRWVIRFAPMLEAKARKLKRQTASSWRVDETYVKVKGKWQYYYRAVDKNGDTVDFYLSENRDQQAAIAFFKKAIGTNGLPEKVVIDKSGANRSALEYFNMLFFITMRLPMLGIEILDIKYLNNIVEQSHRRIKQKMVQALGWKSKAGAEATMAGQETWTMVKRGQIGDPNLSVWQRFYALAA